MRVIPLKNTLESESKLINFQINLRKNTLKRFYSINSLESLTRNSLDDFIV